jgi:hypothetical protein
MGSVLFQYNAMAALPCTPLLFSTGRLDVCSTSQYYGWMS